MGLVVLNETQKRGKSQSLPLGWLGLVGAGYQPLTTSSLDITSVTFETFDQCGEEGTRSAEKHTKLTKRHIKTHFEDSDG